MGRPGGGGARTQTVARLPPQGVNVTALREVKFLRELDSPYIVRLLDVFPQKRGISLVRARRGAARRCTARRFAMPARSAALPPTQPEHPPASTTPHTGL